MLVDGHIYQDAPLKTTSNTCVVSHKIPSNLGFKGNISIATMIPRFSHGSSRHRVTRENTYLVPIPVHRGLHSI